MTPTPSLAQMRQTGKSAANFEYIFSQLQQGEDNFRNWPKWRQDIFRTFLTNNLRIQGNP